MSLLLLPSVFYSQYVVKFSKRFYLIICLIFFLENNLITQKQSGFKPGDSCINQLLSITHEIYKSFNDGFEGRECFLDISKAFDKVWHQGIIFKLRQNDILGELLNILSDFLSNRRQRVVLIVQTSPRAIINSGVSQGSILASLLFSIYINDLTEVLTSTVKLFADDTSLFSLLHNISASTKGPDEDMNKINNWVFQWKINFNPDDSKQAQEVLFSRKL